MNNTGRGVIGLYLETPEILDALFMQIARPGGSALFRLVFPRLRAMSTAPALRTATARLTRGCAPHSASISHKRSEHFNGGRVKSRPLCF